VSSVKGPSRNVLAQLWETTHLLLQAYNQPANFEPNDQSKQNVLLGLADFWEN
jgi:hypothetical protein